MICRDHNVQLPMHFRIQTAADKSIYEILYREMDPVSSEATWCRNVSVSNQRRTGVVLSIKETHPLE